MDMDMDIRLRLSRLEALLDAAPDPLAWVELCAALSEWPDHDRLELGIEFVRARMQAWPRALRTAPEWWRMAWERGIPEPRLVLAGTLEGPLLPATGGGSCPVQHDVYYRDRSYYVRFRSGSLSVSLSGVGDIAVDQDLFEADLDCVESEFVGDSGSWSAEETHVLLSLISAAIRRNDLTGLKLPNSLAALRASEHYMLGSYPIYMARLPDGNDRLRDERYSDVVAVQPCNYRWVELLRPGEPAPAAIEHHLAPIRPPALGPTPAGSRGGSFPWSPWSNPRPAPVIVERRCELRLVRRVAAHADQVNRCVFIDDARVATQADDGTLRVLDLRTYSSDTPLESDSDAITAALVKLEAPHPDAPRELDPSAGCVTLDDRRLVWGDGEDLVVYDRVTGRRDRRPGHIGAIRTCIVGPNGRVATRDVDGLIRVWDIDDDSSLALALDPDVVGFGFLGDGRIAAVDHWALRIWDAQTGCCQAEFAGVAGASLATRGALVVVGQEYGELWVFEVSSAVPV